MTDSSPFPNQPDTRRGFVTTLVTWITSLLVFASPIATAIPALWDPLRRRQAREKKFLPVTTLQAIPDDGIPRAYAVLADRKDAWTLSPQQRIGSVYLRRLPGSADVQAFSAICPHAGCFVGFDPQRNIYQCPCHTSAFTVDGQVIQPSPSPRDLDPLETQVTPAGQVLVAYIQYYPGRHERQVKS